MSAEQKEHVEVLLERSRKTVPQIDKKIDEKERESDGERGEFDQFFKVLRRETKYSKMTASVARAQIQRVFDGTDPDLRRIIARVSAGEDGPSDSGADEVRKDKDSRRRAGSFQINTMCSTGGKNR
uniref:Uncharacterized protein n=1 Tax=Caenorhabditis japonica TaxID=281687 RepID=A0A8R1HVR1_CAEJA